MARCSTNSDGLAHPWFSSRFQRNCRDIPRLWQGYPAITREMCGSARIAPGTSTARAVYNEDEVDTETRTHDVAGL